MTRPDTRSAILQAATDVVAEQGAEHASTRDIYALAGITAPTLYHHFGDKRGLMGAVVSKAFDDYLAEKSAHKPTGDPYVDVARGWDGHVAFAMKNPELYRLMFPLDGELPEAAIESRRLLREGFDQLGVQGHLREGISPELATRTVSAALHGITQMIVREPTNRSNSRVSRIVRDAVLDAVLRSGEVDSLR
jgi:AcrR family transcriptional regulator